MKKVAATSGHNVRREKFFFWDDAAAGTGCGFQDVALAVANFYGFLLKRLTLTTPSPFHWGSRVLAISGHFGGVSSQTQNTSNWMHCNIIFQDFFAEGQRLG
jgi:hypothetical protein